MVSPIMGVFSLYRSYREKEVITSLPGVSEKDIFVENVAFVQKPYDPNRF